MFTRCGTVSPWRSVITGKVGGGAGAAGGGGLKRKLDPRGVEGAHDRARLRARARARGGNSLECFVMLLVRVDVDRLESVPALGKGGGAGGVPGAQDLVRCFARLHAPIT